jgi:hypothetical protein
MFIHLLKDILKLLKIRKVILIGNSNLKTLEIKVDINLTSDIKKKLLKSY